MLAPSLDDLGTSLRVRFNAPPGHSHVAVYLYAGDVKHTVDGTSGSLAPAGQSGKAVRATEDSCTIINGLVAGTVYTATVSSRQADDIQFGPESVRSNSVVLIAPVAPCAPTVKVRGLAASADTASGVHDFSTLERLPVDELVEEPITGPVLLLAACDGKWVPVEPNPGRRRHSVGGLIASGVTLQPAPEASLATACRYRVECTGDQTRVFVRVLPPATKGETRPVDYRIAPYYDLVYRSAPFLLFINGVLCVRHLPAHAITPTLRQARGDGAWERLEVETVARTGVRAGGGDGVDAPVGAVHLYRRDGRRRVRLMYDSAKRRFVSNLDVKSSQFHEEEAGVPAVFAFARPPADDDADADGGRVHASAAGDAEEALTTPMAVPILLMEPTGRTPPMRPSCSPALGPMWPSCSPALGPMRLSCSPALGPMRPLCSSALGPMWPSCSPALGPMRPSCSPALGPMRPSCSPALGPMRPLCSPALGPMRPSCSPALGPM